MSRDLPADYMERQARWVKRMQKAGLFPSAPEPPAPPPPKGQWSITSVGNGQVFIQINDVKMPTALAADLFKLITGVDHGP
jgi:hypothetical protein